ncbi:hypothetical protein ES703_44065 [subsurface metagenome]
MTVVMAKLTAMPEQAIIDGFKGIVDFYLWMGIPVARAWPKSPGKVRSPAVMAQWPLWTYAAREWKNVSQTVRDAYSHLATNSGLSSKDMFTRAYLSGLYRYPTP